VHLAPPCGIDARMELADAVVQDVEGRPAKLAEVWKDRPAVLVFLRHFG
jgi:hypothetical protein